VVERPCATVSFADPLVQAHLAAVATQEQRRLQVRAVSQDPVLTLDCDILVIGGGAAGLWTAISAARHAAGSLRIHLVDARMVGRTGHTAFSNAWTIVVLPEDDLGACTRDIIEGNEWMADQELVYAVLASSYDRLLDMERYGLVFPRDASGHYVRRPTRGLRVNKVHHPVGGGLEFCWRLREAAAALGVEIVDRVFVTALVPAVDGRVAGAIGIDARTGEVYYLRAKATVIATNSMTFRSGFVRDITGTGTVMAYDAGAVLSNAEFSYLRPGTPKFYFEGITFAIQDGARFINRHGHAFMPQYEPEWGDFADVQRIAAALCKEKQNGNAPIYLDMSLVPPEHRDFYFHSAVKWMDMFLSKLPARAKIDMFGRTQYYPLNQMTKLAIHTDSACRTGVPGLLAAGLAQASCATHFAGFHIGVCIGTGWIAGRTAVDYATERGHGCVERTTLLQLRDALHRSLEPNAAAGSDEILRDLQRLMFRWDVTVLKEASRLQRALGRLAELRERARALAAPDPHELVRLKELEGMLAAAEMILQASRLRTESRLSHIREDFPERDDRTWIKRVLIRKEGDAMRLSTAPIPTPLVPCPVSPRAGAPGDRVAAEREAAS